MNDTITNHPTHMSVYGMRNRFGNLIDSLTIANGVPKTLPTGVNDGIIIYSNSISNSKTKSCVVM